MAVAATARAVAGSGLSSGPHATREHTTTMSYDKPFAGLKVIDVSQGVAGPYCAMLLAQYGANVIKVEPPGVGDWARNLGVVYGDQCAYSLPANLGKRAIALDLKQHDGQAILWRLIAGADVFLQGFRPGVIDRLGFGYAAVAEREPRIIYLSVSGFGQTGPAGGTARDGPDPPGLHRPDSGEQRRGRHPAPHADHRDRHEHRASTPIQPYPPPCTPAATNRAAATSRPACCRPPPGFRSCA